ncbi:YihY/virulence factor BrkB family protein [Dinoroseobacter sp. PD6]|uniref:YihY/virulence factor BrkB family protein n=1 Tax=Dinoroseobacter sp. PD6 TaxID=3028384 RepID=UPI00237A26B9|nr:YihY/virulence factor BrkB family protein [Dinoroseobacter sp. PD6]MDD9715846.1 YihY/virulence factor BrkB family protein [Dinoroseobacter sp. PD6]
MPKTDTDPENPVPEMFRHDRRQWMKALQSVGGKMDGWNIGLISAGVAFYGLLAIFPALAAVIAIWGLVADPMVVDQQMALVGELMPQEAYRLIDAQIDALTQTTSSTLGWATLLSILAALWSTRAGVSALMRGLNAIYGTPNRKSWRHYLAALSLTAVLVLVALVALTAVVITPIVLAFLPLGSWTELALRGTRWVVAIGVLLAGLSIVYRYGPNRTCVKMQWLTPGSIAVVVLWAAASLGFSYYLSNFGNYNEVYGSIGAVIALLMWLYISAFLLLLGAGLNVELERRAGLGPDAAARAEPPAAPPTAGVIADSGSV